MGTPLVNGCLACVYFSGQRLAPTKFAQQEVHNICEKWWMAEDNNYEEVPRSRPAQCRGMLLHAYAYRARLSRSGKEHLEHLPRISGAPVGGSGSISINTLNFCDGGAREGMHSFHL